MIIQQYKIDSTIIKIDDKNIEEKEQTHEQINTIISLLIKKLHK